MDDQNQRFHLSEESARNLVERVFKTYRSKLGGNPKELFIHGRTEFTHKEREAFSGAVPDGTNIVAIRIKKAHGDTEIYRAGDCPTIRGTVQILGEKDTFFPSDCVPRVALLAQKLQCRYSSLFCAPTGNLLTSRRFSATSRV